MQSLNSIQRVIMRRIEVIRVLLIVVVCSITVVNTQHGAYQDVSITDPDVIKASEEAFKFYQNITPDFKSVGYELIKAEQQVVDGKDFHYKISFKTQVSDETETASMQCTGLVFKAPGDSKFETKEMDCESRNETE
ncbi:uncharacterized protein LOC113231972 [Hyposmocoma kahamanoa]|uniref:uncharacterized protein LOC113231972 n=1 Tax=Hyposmocoma kahamanoa TaxID=1477025 RepID=UPI000E6D6BBE|nr:uncharacterized protein LOC113231972 [Hyposmocoma kahamanoa]